MTKYIGRLTKLGVGKEDTRGAGVTPDLRIPFLNLDFDDEITEVTEEAGLGKLADADDSFVTTNYAAGSLESEIRSQSFGYFLYALLGSLSTSGTDDYTHSFSVSDTNTHQSLAFLVEDPNTTEMYKLVMLDTLEIIMELDEIVRFNASFNSKQGVGSTDSVPAMTEEYKFTKKHLSFKVASNIAGLSGASAVSLKRLRISFSKNTMLDDVLGTAEPEDILNRQLSIEGEVELNYEDETWKNYFRNNTHRAMEIKLTNTDETIDSENPSLTMQFPKVSFFEWQPNYARDEIVTQTLSFRAFYDAANDTEIISTCDLVNGKASY